MQGKQIMFSLNFLLIRIVRVSVDWLKSSPEESKFSAEFNISFVRPISFELSGHHNRIVLINIESSLVNFDYWLALN